MEWEAIEKFWANEEYDEFNCVTYLSDGSVARYVEQGWDWGVRWDSDSPVERWQMSTPVHLKSNESKRMDNRDI